MYELQAQLREQVNEALSGAEAVAAAAIEAGRLHADQLSQLQLERNALHEGLRAARQRLTDMERVLEQLLPALSALATGGASSAAASPAGPAAAAAAAGVPLMLVAQLRGLLSDGGAPPSPAEGGAGGGGSPEGVAGRRAGAGAGEWRLTASLRADMEALREEMRGLHAELSQAAAATPRGAAGGEDGGARGAAPRDVEVHQQVAAMAADKVSATPALGRLAVCSCSLVAWRRGEGRWGAG